jgi:heterodisulfide reductase subunit B
MEYLYYPGCSLEGAARQYDESLRAVFQALGVGLRPLEDWNCCGATIYMSVDETTSLAVSARNLALAGRDGQRDLIAPCSACYTVLLKTNRYLTESPELRQKVDALLAKAGLSYRLNVTVRHPLDVLVNDVGIERIAAAASRRLDGLRVAPYYGCQIVRPERGFDHSEFPETMDRLSARWAPNPSTTRSRRAAAAACS